MSPKPSSVGGLGTGRKDVFRKHQAGEALPDAAKIALQGGEAVPGLRTRNRGASRRPKTTYKKKPPAERGGTAAGTRRRVDGTAGQGIK